MVRFFRWHAVLFLLLTVSPALGVSRQEVLGVAPRQPAQNLIDEKCLACHNRRRIEAAVHDRKDMERIVRRMEKKGVVLTDTQRQVLSHFWRKNPYKGEEGTNAPPAAGAGIPH